MDSTIHVGCREIAERLARGERIRFVDLRGPEFGFARIPGTEAATEELMESLLRLPKDTEIVFHCHHGISSLEVAGFFREHGFQNAKSLSGGIAAWSREVDPGIPTY